MCPKPLPLPRTFRVRPFWWFLYAVSFIIPLPYFLLASGNFWISICTCTVIIILFIALYKTRLILTPEGITFSTLGLYMFTPWQNIASEGFRLWGVILAVKSLRLRQPFLQNLTIEEGNRRGVAVVQDSLWGLWWSLMTYGYFSRNWLTIPLLVRPFRWSRGELAAYVQHYADLRTTAHST